MIKSKSFSPLTISQNSTLASLSRLSHIRQTITIPSKRNSPNSRQSAKSPLGGLHNAIVKNLETLHQLSRMWDSDKINKVVDILQDALNEENGTEITYEVTLHVDWSGDIYVDSVKPKDSVSLGEEPSCIRCYTIDVTAKRGEPYSYDLKSLTKKVDQVMNINPKIKEGFDKITKDSFNREASDRIKGDATFDKGYKDQRDRAEGHGREVVA